MVAAVHAALLSLLIVWTPPPGRGDPVFVSHVREHGRTFDEREAYVHQLAEWMVREAEEQHVPVWLVVALAMRESGGDPKALSRIDGVSLGTMQLNPASYWGESWRKECRGKGRASCAEANLRWGTRALKDGHEQCRSWRRAVVFYRSGRCGGVKQEVWDGADRVLALTASLWLEHGLGTP